MFTKDIYQKLINPSATDTQMLKIRASRPAWQEVSVYLSLVLYGSTAILDIVYFAYTLRGSLFVVLLFAIYWKKLPQKEDLGNAAHCLYRVSLDPL